MNKIVLLLGLVVFFLAGSVQAESIRPIVWALSTNQDIQILNSGELSFDDGNWICKIHASKTIYHGEQRIMTCQNRFASEVYRVATSCMDPAQETNSSSEIVTNGNGHRLVCSLQ